MAVSNKNATAILDVSGENDAYNLTQFNNKLDKNIQIVKTVTLPTFCNKYKIHKIDVLLMDVEGSEYDIFSSSINYIKKHVKVLFVEMHSISEEKSPDKIIQILKKANFKVVYLRKNVLCAFNLEIKN